MPSWRSIELFRTEIMHETEKAYLLKMPSRTEWKKWVFWHPKKLTEVRTPTHVTLRFSDEWVFTLRRKERLDTELSTDRFIGIIENSWTVEPEGKSSSEHYFNKTNPEILAVKHVEVLHEFLND